MTDAKTTDSSSPSFRTLPASASVVGAHGWVERRLFEVLGGWVGIESDDQATVLFAKHSRQHGWHSELWTELLPVARGLEASDLVVPPSAEVAALFDGLAGVDDPDATVQRLGAVYLTLLPQLLLTCARHLDTASVVAESPMIRALTLVVRDDTDQQAEGVALFDVVESASEGAAELDPTLAEAFAAVADAGGLFAGT
jgi:hypothetical protein